MSKFLISLIRLYQKFWSSWHLPVCRFYPSCSEYAIQALQEYNKGHAFFLIFRRIIRCHPLCSGGYDPLPRRE